MKKIFFLVICAVACMHSSHVFAQKATIKIDILRQLGDIDRNIYGVFMEPILKKTKGKSFNYSFPAHSFTQIIAEIK